MKHIFAGLVIALFGFLSEAQAEETANKAIKIGCLYPTTGPAGLYGRDSTVAIQMALDHVQDTYGDDAPQLDVMIEDTRSRSLRSLQIARAFIHEEAIDFLCGVLSSDIALLVAIEAAKAETFFIGAGHASPSVILHERHPFYFRANNGSRQSMFAGAQYIKENHSRADRPLKIAFIGPDYELGYQAWGDLRGFLNQQGVAFDVVGEYWPKL
ncbi:MAG: ABC transporter substrate-binding protein, partial [Sulfitobacter sp.]